MIILGTGLAIMFGAAAMVHGVFEEFDTYTDAVWWCLMNMFDTGNVAEEDKPLRKQIMSIVTDATPLEEPKDADNCIVFQLYQLLASEEKVAEMRKNLEAGGYGYGHAKQELFDVVVERFANERKTYKEFIENPEMLEQELQKGALKAKLIASKVIKRVREKAGY